MLANVFMGVLAPILLEASGAVSAASPGSFSIRPLTLATPAGTSFSRRFAIWIGADGSGKDFSAAQKRLAFLPEQHTDSIPRCRLARSSALLGVRSRSRSSSSSACGDRRRTRTIRSAAGSLRARRELARSRVGKCGYDAQPHADYSGSAAVLQLWRIVHARMLALDREKRIERKGVAGAWESSRSRAHEGPTRHQIAVPISLPCFSDARFPNGLV